MDFTRLTQIKPDSADGEHLGTMKDSLDELQKRLADMQKLTELQAQLSSLGLYDKYVDAFTQNDFSKSTGVFDINSLSSLLFGERTSFLSLLANMIMFTFIYYIPKLIFFRVSRFSKEMNQTSFIPIFILSLMALIGSISHVISFYINTKQHEMMKLVLGTNRDELIIILWKCMCISTNRVISPLVTLVTIQQAALSSTRSDIKNFLKRFYEISYCVLAIIVVFGCTFYSGWSKFESLGPGKTYEDDTDLSLVDIIPPIFAYFAFHSMKDSISRKEVYATDSGPDAPRTIDRVSKVIVFQQVMVIFAVISHFLRRPGEVGVLHNAYTFFMSAQTPVIHFVLMRSLVRSKKSRKLCFLLCCLSEEKVDIDGTTIETKSPNARKATHQNEIENGKIRSNSIPNK